MSEVLAIIPARGGSKRVKNKNIKGLAGKPLIAYTFEAALSSKKIDRVIVSTDDKKIIAVAKSYGIEVPFVRPDDIAEDATPDQPVFNHALKKLFDIDGYQPDIVVNLRPTSPFKTGGIIDRVISEISATNVDIVRTMTRSEGVNHPYWMYRLDDRMLATQFVDDIDINEYYQSQMLPHIYRINGVVDAYKVTKIMSGNILSGNIKGIVLNDRESMDIDTEFDFELCEMMLKYVTNRQ